MIMSDWWEKRGGGPSNGDPPYPKILPSKTPSLRWQWVGSWLIYSRLWPHCLINIDPWPKLTDNTGKSNISECWCYHVSLFHTSPMGSKNCGNDFEKRWRVSFEKMLLWDDKSAPQRNDILRTCVHLELREMRVSGKRFPRLARKLHKVHLSGSFSDAFRVGPC